MLTIFLLCCVVAALQRRSVLVESGTNVKRRCALDRVDSGDVSDTASVSSDTSDVSTVNPSTGKRVLPQPKFTVC